MELRAVALITLTLLLAGCSDGSSRPSTQPSAADSQRLEELTTYAEDYARCVETNDDAVYRDKFKAAFAEPNAVVAIRYARRARVLVERQRACIARAGGSGLEQARATIDRELKQIAKGYAEAALGTYKLASGGKGGGTVLNRGEARQQKAAGRLGKAIGRVLEEYVRLGGSYALVSRIRRAI